MAKKTITQLPALEVADIDGADQLVAWDAETGTTKKMSLSNIFNSIRDDVQGYFGVLTNFYFTGGVATETAVAVEDINQWIDVEFVTDAQGLFDNRPAAMKEAAPDPFDDTTKYFTLEGLSQDSSVTFRASMTFEPDEDEGQLTTRLNFERHSGTNPSEDFQITDVALAMGQGADIEYPAEPTLTFFVGDTIDTNGPGDARRCKFQINSTVPGTVRMLALTWYIQK